MSGNEAKAQIIKAHSRRERAQGRAGVTVVLPPGYPAARVVSYDDQTRILTLEQVDDEVPPGAPALSQKSADRRAEALVSALKSMGLFPERVRRGLEVNPGVQLRVDFSGPRDTVKRLHGVFGALRSLRGVDLMGWTLMRGDMRRATKAVSAVATIRGCWLYQDNRLGLVLLPLLADDGEFDALGELVDNWHKERPLPALVGLGLYPVVVEKQE